MMYAGKEERIAGGWGERKRHVEKGTSKPTTH